MSDPKHDQAAKAVADGLGGTVDRVQTAFTSGALDTIGIPQPSDEQLRSITSFADAKAFAEEQYGALRDFAEEYGTGFKILSHADKAKLIDKELIILFWRIHEGDYGRFISAAVVTASDEKFILNDGSTGIANQLAQITFETGQTSSLLVRSGLRESVYSTCKKCGTPRRPDDAVCPSCGDESAERSVGRTFYLNNA